MKRFTDDEIRFIRGTNYTATVWQNDEWSRTIWGEDPSYDQVVDYCLHNNIYSVYNRMSAAEFLKILHDKFNTVEDNISLEMLAIYLFRNFCTPEELVALLKAPTDGFFRPSALWLHDWKYNFGFRKWTDADSFILQALDPNIQLDLSKEEIWYIENGEH